MIGSFTYLKNRIIVNLEGLTPTANYLLAGTGSAWTTTNSPTLAGLDLTGITNGNVPYMSATGFADSSMSYNGTTVTCTGAADSTAFQVKNSSDKVVARFQIEADGHGQLILEDENSINYVSLDSAGPSYIRGGYLGLGGEIDPITPIEISNANPHLTLHNTSQEDTDGGRESRIIARGEQSGGEESVLGYMEFAHDGTSDDEKGLWRVLLNDGDDSDAPSITALTLVSSGKATLYGPLDCGADGASQGILTLWDGAGGNTPGNIKIHSPNGTAWYLFVEDDGTVKIHNAAPTQNSDGSAVGDQSD